jgi:hypothetical protein
MKRKVVLVLLIVMIFSMFMVGCEDQADVASYNLSKQADNFNIMRELTVINAMTGDVMFQMTGRMSIETDSYDDQLEVIVEVENGVYRKHFIYLGTMCLYTCEDLGESQIDVYNYTLNFNPKMWLPVRIETVD